MQVRQSILIALVALCTFANAQYQLLYNFSAASHANPLSSLTSDGTFLYGMTEYGGSSDSGFIFKIKPDGTGYTELLDFNGQNGSTPYECSLFYNQGFLFGMTHYGGSGSYCSNGCGVLFKIKTDGTGFTKVLDFAGLANGSEPAGSLIFDGTFLYGIASGGGINDDGVIFKIKPDSTGYADLYNFSGSPDGKFPCGSPVSDATFLYGMTAQGGVNDFGIIFKVKPDGTGYTKLLDFDGAVNGRFPQGSLIYDETFLYGMTSYGGANDKGVVFKIKSDGTGYSKLVDFAGYSNGENPNGDLISDGTFLYGMTTKGGEQGSGTVFKIKPDGTEYSKIVDFKGLENGSYPYGSLNSLDNALYGMTIGGGAYNTGVIFKIDLSYHAGIADYKIDSDISIFPNPFSTLINVQTKNDLKGATLILYNSLGEVVREIKNISGKKFSIPRGNLPNGPYFISITQHGEMITTRKIITGDQ